MYLQEITHSINVQIFPVVLMPVTALLCLVFYNRMIALNTRFRKLQEELRDIFLIEETENRNLETLKMLKLEKENNRRRVKCVQITLGLSLLGILCFTLSTLIIALSSIHPKILTIATVLWPIGPLLVSIAIIFGILELFVAFRGQQVQCDLIDEWETH